MILGKTIKIYNFEHIIGGEVRFRTPIPPHMDIRAKIVGVEEDEHFYKFRLEVHNGSYQVYMWEIMLVRHGTILESLPYSPVWVLKDTISGENMSILKRDIEHKPILLKRMGQLMEMGKV